MLGVVATAVRLRRVAKLGLQCRPCDKRVGASYYATDSMIVFRPFIKEARFILQRENFERRSHMYSSGWIIAVTYTAIQPGLLLPTTIASSRPKAQIVKARSWTSCQS